LDKKKFDEKIKKYHNLNKQIKKMNKIKKKLNDELKEDIKQRKKFEFEIMGLRIALSEKERTNPDNNKIKKFLLDKDEKISDYYKKSKFWTLTVVEIETTLKMENIDE